MNTVFTIGIFLCFFLQFLLLSKKQASTSDRILAVWMFVFGLHWLGYWEVYPHLSGIRHQNIFTEQINLNLRIVEPKSAGEYNRSGLKDDDAVRYHKKLTELMKTSKPYLQPKLTLSNLADELDISIICFSEAHPDIYLPK
jgi:hypothetical protein